MQVAGTETAARAALAELYATADTVDMPECTRLVRTLGRWQEEILISDRTHGLSNGQANCFGHSKSRGRKHTRLGQLAIQYI